MTDTQRMAAAGFVLASVVLSGCAGHSFAPTPVPAVAFESRAITEIQGPVRVSTVVPDAEETERIFGVPLYDSGLQPVWIEIENRGDEPVRLALVSLDPEYFSPLEVAYTHRKGFGKEGRAAMEAWFHEHGMVRRVPLPERLVRVLSLPIWSPGRRPST